MTTLQTSGSSVLAAEADGPAESPAQTLVDLFTSLAAEHADRRRLIDDIARSIERGNGQLRAAGLSPTY